MWLDLNEEPFDLFLIFSLKTLVKLVTCPEAGVSTVTVPLFPSIVGPLFNPEAFYSELEELASLPGDGLG